MQKKRRERANNILPCPEPFVMIPNKLILDPAFNSLTSSSIRVYILLLTRWTRDKEKVRKPVILTYSQ